MATKIRPEISKNNKYYISRHRYYELKHFCLQYKEFKREYSDLCSHVKTGPIEIKKDIPKGDKRTFVRQRYLDMILLIEDSALETDFVMYDYILKGVTEGLPYTYFKTVMKIPCCKDTYYELYRKFFYILSNKKFYA